jgi:hypothetical protein
LRPDAFSAWQEHLAKLQPLNPIPEVTQSLIESWRVRRAVVEDKTAG